MSRGAQGAQKASTRKGPRGPISMVSSLVLSFIGSVFIAIIVGTVLEVVGLYSFWKPMPGAQGHAYLHLLDDFAYVERSPRSIFVADTVTFTKQLADWARRPFLIAGFPQLIAKARRPAAHAPEALRSVSLVAAACLEILVYVTQDVAVRLALALYALPGLLILLTVGIVDGLVQRDIRKWAGGRESSFVYHHAKHYAKWLLSMGFALYLGWPFSGMNPIYLLLIFGLLTAFALAVTCATFKKYL